MSSSKVVSGKSDSIYIDLNQRTDENQEVYLAASLVIFDFGVNAVLEELGPLDTEGNTEITPQDIDNWEMKWTRFCEENHITLWVSVNVSEWRNELGGLEDADAIRDGADDPRADPDYYVRAPEEVTLTIPPGGLVCSACGRHSGLPNFEAGKTVGKYYYCDFCLDLGVEGSKDNDAHTDPNAYLGHVPRYDPNDPSVCLECEAEREAALQADIRARLEAAEPELVKARNQAHREQKD